MRRFIVVIAIFVFLISSNSIPAIAGQVYLSRDETWGGNLTDVYYGSLAMGDIDGDNDLDLVLTGQGNSVDVAKIYLNNGTTFSENQAWQQNLIAMRHGCISLGDIDNDGDLDLAMAGCISGGGQSPCNSMTAKVYMNDGTSLVENSTWNGDITPAYDCSNVFGDVDSDGDLDMAMIGYGTEGATAKIHINNGTGFNENQEWQKNLAAVFQGSLAWGDMDKDGDLDMVLTGDKGVEGKITRIYINNGSSLIESSSWGKNLMGVDRSSVILGDFDNDNDLDMALIGQLAGDHLHFYLNNGSTFVLNQDEAWGGLCGYFRGSIGWGDYDNDGDLDIAAIGKELGCDWIYNNNNTTFEIDYSASDDLHADNMQQSALTWGDIDGDNDLDLIASGVNAVELLTVAYINNITAPNAPPASPQSNLNSSFNFSAGKLTLSWDTGSDAETSTLGLYYNLRVGTCSGCHDIVSGIYGGYSGGGGGGGPSAGYFGNMMQRKSITLNRPDLQNKTIYWAVQTIDTGLAKSNWSEEQVYAIGTCVEDWSYSEWSPCGGGIQTRTATDLNECGTTDNRSAISRSCTVEDGSTGPTGPGGFVPPVDPNTYTKQWSYIQSGKEESFTVNRENISVAEIKIRTKESASNPSVTVSRLFEKPVGEAPGARVYQYLEINHTNLEGKLSNVTITFAVSSSWMEENDISHSTVSLNRLVNGSWEKLETRLKEEGDDYVYEAFSPGLSFFSITGEEILPVICDAGELRCSGSRLEKCSDEGTAWQLVKDCAHGCLNNTCLEAVCQAGMLRCNGDVLEQCNVVRWIPTEECEFGCAGGECMEFPPYYYGLIAAAVIAGMVIGMWFFVLKRRPKNKNAQA